MLSTWRRLERDRDASGFTLVEMVIALTLMASFLLASAFVLFGSMRAFSAARSRSIFVQIANREMEKIRALPYKVAGVAASDANRSSAYPGGKFDGRDEVLSCTPTSPPAPDCPSDPAPLPAVEVVSTSTISSIPLPYTIRRWITWTDAQGGSSHVFKRLTVQLEWNERGIARSFRLHSVFYPGGQGPAAAPVAAFSATPVSGTAPLAVVFDASASTGQGLTYSWVFGDGGTGSGQTISYLYNNAGSFSASLTVTDSGGLTNSTSKTITANSTGPVAAFTASPDSGVVPLTVAFDASGSTGTAPLSYAWDFGDGSTGVGVTASREYTVAGTYTVTLKVTDPNGLTSSTTRSINATGSGCSISAAWIENDGRTNRIIVKADGSISKNPVTFKVQTTSSCTSVASSITQLSAPTTAGWTVQTNAGGKLWTVSLNATTTLNTGCAQTGTATSDTAQPKSFTYAVYRQNNPCP